MCEVGTGGPMRGGCKSMGRVGEGGPYWGRFWWVE